MPGVCGYFRPAVEIVVKVPSWTPSESTVYLSGSCRELGHWKPDGLKLHRMRDGTWHGRVRLSPGESTEFKVTLGAWDRVEKDFRGWDVPNRSLVEPPRPYPGGSGGGGNVEAVAYVEVANWGTGEEGQRRDDGALLWGGRVVGDLEAHERFYSHVLGNYRTLWVWLPPGYRKETTRRYPVVYMHDGQNLFDARRSSFGVKWAVDEAATKLVETGRTRPFIVVGVENTIDRFGEYTPTAAGGIGGRGQLYGRFLTGQVVPFINATYRTLTGPDNTYTAGSSLGGLVSLFLLREYPGVFGGCGAISPSLWWDGEDLLKGAERDARWCRGKRVWIDMGTAEAGWGEEAQHVARVRRMCEAMLAGGMDKSLLACEIVPGARHDEAAWAARVDRILEHLIGR